MLGLLLLFACETTSTTEAPSCAFGTPVLTPASAAVGDSVVVSMSLLTEVFDTAVTVGSTRATVSDLSREDCDDCDTCLDTGGCSVCDDTCDDTCGETCATCSETLTFVVPDLAPGDYPVEIVNRHGRSVPVTLTIEPLAVSH